MELVTRLLLLALVVTSGALSAPQTSGVGVDSRLSTKANEFYIGFMENAITVRGESVQLFVTTDEENTVSFMVEVVDPPFSISGTAQYGAITTISLPVGVQVSNNDERNKAVHIKAEEGKQISVYGSNYAHNTADMFAALPCIETPVSSLRQQRYHIFSGQGADSRSSSFLIVGCSDDTVVRIFPTANIALPADLQPSLLLPLPGQRSTLTMQKGQTLYAGSVLGDLSGTIITSEKPIAVFTGHQCAQVPNGMEGCDHIVEQIPPHFTWGKLFFTSSLLGRKSGERLRIAPFDSSSDTEVNITCINATEGVELSGNNTVSAAFQTYYDYTTGPDEFCCIEASRPVFVVQYSMGYTTDSLLTGSDFGDPFLMTIPAVEQYSNRFTITTEIEPSTNFEHRLNIIAPIEYFNNSRDDRNNVRVNGTRALGTWYPIYCASRDICAYGTRIPLGVGTANVYHQNVDARIGAFVYGIGSRSSYGYTAGYNVDPIMYPIVNLSISEYSLMEAQGSVTALVSRYGETSAATDVEFTTTGISAAVGSDFLDSTQTIVFLPGETLKVVTISILDDDMVEDDEILQVSISVADSDVVLLESEANVTILDDDTFIIGFVSPTYTIDEASGIVRLVVRSNVPNPGPNVLVLRFTTERGTATPGVDYLEVNSTVVFAVGDREKTVTVDIFDDRIVEGMDEFFFGKLVVESEQEGAILDPEKTSITIVDINMVEILVSPSSVSLLEDEGSVSLQVEKRGMTGLTTNLIINTRDATATAQEDYVPLVNVPIMFLPNETEYNLTLTILADNALENDEVFMVVISVPEGEDRVSLLQPTSTINILNDDRVELMFDNSLYPVDEAGGNVTVTIVKEGTSNKPIPITFSTQDVDAIASIDYESVSQSLQFEPTDSTLSVTVEIRDDSIVETPERFTITITSLEVGVDIPFQQGTVLIEDDDTVSIGFRPVNYTIFEGTGTVELHLIKMGDNDRDVTVDLSTEDGSAIGQLDYTDHSAIVTFTSSDDEIVVPIVILDDNFLEPTEHFFAQLLPVSGVVIIPQRAQVDIQDDDIVMVGFAPLLYSVDEGGMMITLRLEKSGNTSEPVPVEVFTVDGSATAGEDYIPLPPTRLIFGEDETSLPVMIRIMDDVVVEGREEFIVRVRVPEGEMGTNIGSNTATVSILDDDEVIVRFEPPEYRISESAGIVALRIIKEGQATISVTVAISTADLQATALKDYDATTVNVTFDPFMMEGFVSVGIQEDSVYEGAEEFRVLLDAVSPGVMITTREVTVIIEDNDVVTVGFDPVSVDTSEAALRATLTIVKMGDNDIPVDLNLITLDGTATAPGDYEPLTSLVSFSPNDSEQRVNVTVREDDILESTEVFFARLLPSVGVEIGLGTEEVTVRITDSTTGVAVGFNTTGFMVDEGEGVAMFTVVVFGSVERSVTVDFITEGLTASAGEDYIFAFESLTFESGETVKVVGVALIDDPILEGNEMFLARLSSSEDEVIFTQSNATVTIVDNDRVVIGFDPVEYTVGESDREVVLRVTKSGIAHRSVNVTFSTDDQTAFGNIVLVDIVDYVPVERTLTFDPEDIEHTISVEILDNNAVERTEVFRGILGIPPGEDGVEHGPSTATVTIIDNDVVQLGFSQGNFLAFESEPTVSLILVKFGESQVDIEIEVTTEDETAMAPSDYVMSNMTIEFEAMSTIMVITARIRDDVIVEERETFLVRLRLPNAGNGVDLINNTAVVTITDNDVVQVRFEVEYVQVIEGNSVTLTITKTGTAVRPVNMNVSTSSINNTAVGGEDYEAFSQEIVLQPEENSINVMILVFSDGVLEARELFAVFLSGGLGVVVASGGGEVTVEIVDEDVLVVGFEAVRYTVGEEEGAAEVCFNKSADTEVELEFRISIVPGSALVESDYSDINRTISCSPGDTTMMCVSVPILDDDTVEATENLFVTLQLVGSGLEDAGSRISVTPNRTEISIIDDDSPPLCRVEDSILITPFQGGDRNYNFHGACEHILVSTCDVNPIDFIITVDFIASNLDMGRVGVKLGNRSVVIDEDLSARVFNLGDPITQDGDATEYTGGVTILQGANQTVIFLSDYGIQVSRVRDGQNHVLVNISGEGAISEVCGLCGTIDGVLLYSDRGSTANIVNRMEVEMFANSWRVNPGEQFLREERRECGFLGNDSIIGDPLFTVPLYDRNGSTPVSGHVIPSLCFEIHGATNEIFNLVSDRCTSVNALYGSLNTPDNGNIITAVGVIAVNRQAECVDIRVSLEEGCMPLINQVLATSRYSSSGVSVRKYGQRVRISVPNCENTQLVMWLLCEEIEDQGMIRFVMSRGVNLQPTSHGLLGQFWNIPITFEPYNGTDLDTPDGFILDNLYEITIDHPSAPPRTFVSELYHRTWEGTRAPCYYAGSSQGGPLNEFDAPRDSVIQGRYSDYRVDGLYETDFSYSRFDSSLCL